MTLHATSTSPSAVASRLEWIDTAKGLAILAIVYFHFCGSINAPYGFNSQIGVDTFLILSGFGLTISKNTDGGFAEFLQRRLLRILPRYWLVLACVILINLFAFKVPIPWKDAALHLICAHLFAGEPYAFSLNMSFWYMGLIVPLYLMLLPLRFRFRGPNGVTWALVFTAAMALLGWAVLTFGAGWGGPVQAHSSGRVVSFAVGCLLGSIYLAGPAPSLRQASTPVAAAALALWGALGVNAWKVDVILYPVGGLVIACAAIALTASPHCLKIARYLAGLGAISYELYLVHQYLLLTIGPAVILPRLSKTGFFVRADELRLLACSGLLALAAAGVIAWILHTLLERIHRKESWNRSLRGTVFFLGLIGIAAGGIVVTRQPPPPPVLLLVEKLQITTLHTREPVLYWGLKERADLILLEHDTKGQLRLGIDHWGHPIVFGPWITADNLAGKTLQIHRDETGIAVMLDATPLVVSTQPPYDSNSLGSVGRNDIGFTTSTTVATSTFRILSP